MKNLKSLRKGKRVSQEQLGNNLGFGKNTISQYETGIREPNLDTLIKLADYFNVSVDYLIGREKNTTTEVVVQKVYSDAQQRCVDVLLNLPDNLLVRAERYLMALADENRLFTLKKLN